MSTGKSYRGRGCDNFPGSAVLCPVAGQLCEVRTNCLLIVTEVTGVWGGGGRKFVVFLHVLVQ